MYCGSSPSGNPCHRNELKDVDRPRRWDFLLAIKCAAVSTSWHLRRTHCSFVSAFRSHLTISYHVRGPYDFSQTDTMPFIETNPLYIELFLWFFFFLPFVTQSPEPHCQCDWSNFLRLKYWATSSYMEANVRCGIFCGAFGIISLAGKHLGLTFSVYWLGIFFPPPPSFPAAKN